MATAVLHPSLRREPNTYDRKHAHEPFQSIQNIPSLISLTAARERTSSHVERKLGETEVSYFLPSRDSGVNDMWATSKHGLFKLCTYNWYLIQVFTPRVSSSFTLGWAPPGSCRVGNYANSTPTSGVKGQDEHLRRYLLYVRYIVISSQNSMIHTTLI